jgi:hypothetical protein
MMIEDRRMVDVALRGVEGRVELNPGFVGFRCTQPNLLRDAAVMAKCGTQQRPISGPGPLSRTKQTAIERIRPLPPKSKLK